MRRFDVNFRAIDGAGQPVAPAAADAAGLECPTCGCRHFRTLKTGGRPGGFILRRKMCRHCGRRVTTRESVIGARQDASSGPAREFVQDPALESA